MDIHFSRTFSTQNFKGFCGKTNIKINRKVGIKIKHTLGGICALSIPSKYLFLFARRKFRFNKKICRKLLFVYMYYKQNSCTTPWSVGWRNLFKTVEKEFLQPTRSECIRCGLGNLIGSSRLISLSVCLFICLSVGYL